MGLFGSIGRALGGAVTGFLGGGPVGAIAGAVGGIVGGGSRPGSGAINLPPPPPLPSPFGAMPWPGTPGNPGVALVQPTSYGLPTRVDTNPNRFPVPGGNVVTSPLGTNAMVPKGYHVNRALERAARSPTPGNVRRAQQVVRAIVKNQSMNVLNPRALRRAARRAKGFIRFSRKIVKYYQPKAPKGRAYIRMKGKR